MDGEHFHRSFIFFGGRWYFLLRKEVPGFSCQLSYFQLAGKQPTHPVSVKAEPEGIRGYQILSWSQGVILQALPLQ